MENVIPGVPFGGRPPVFPPPLMVPPPSIYQNNVLSPQQGPHGHGYRGHAQPHRRTPHPMFRPPHLGYRSEGPLRPPYFGPHKHKPGKGFKRTRDGNSTFHTQQDTSPNKQQKMEKNEKFTYFCETCDRGFKLQQTFQEHCDNHVKCPHNGCSYTAAAKLVKLHDQWQHRTGLAKKIWQLESKADIEKWRNERKKNFPTAENIAKKQKNQAEKIARGEVLDTELFSKMRGRGRGRGGGDNRRGRGNRGGRGYRGRENRDHDHKGYQDNTYKESNEQRGGSHKKRYRKKKQDNHFQKQDWKNTDDKITNEEVKRNDKLDPLAYVLHSGDEASSDENEKSKVDPSLAQMLNTSSNKSSEVQPKFAGALGALVSSYGDITDSEEEGQVNDEPIQKVINPSPLKEAKTEINTNQHQSTLQQVATTEKSTSIQFGDPNRTSPPDNATKSRRDHRNKKQRKVQRQKPTLLQMLLAPEIRHERNVILQCVCHIVKQNFYGIGPGIKPEKMVKEKLEAVEKETVKENVEKSEASVINKIVIKKEPMITSEDQNLQERPAFQESVVNDCKHKAIDTHSNKESDITDRNQNYVDDDSWDDADETQTLNTAL